MAHKYLVLHQDSCPKKEKNLDGLPGTFEKKIVGEFDNQECSCIFYSNELRVHVEFEKFKSNGKIKRSCSACINYENHEIFEKIKERLKPSLIY